MFTNEKSKYCSSSTKKLFSSESSNLLNLVEQPHNKRIVVKIQNIFVINYHHVLFLNVENYTMSRGLNRVKKMSHFEGGFCGTNY